MKPQERYNLLLEELAELLKSKNDIISIQNYQIESLRRKLGEFDD